VSVKAVILGLLKSALLHGYEIKRIIEHEMGDWTDIAFGSIHFALDALAKDGFVLAEVEKSERRRQSRIVYRITGTGEEEIFPATPRALTGHNPTSKPNRHRYRLHTGSITPRDSGKWSEFLRPAEESTSRTKDAISVSLND
jgi:hypothetical protein